MATTRLQLYNIAAAALGETELTSLTENREIRRVLDQVWSWGNGLVYGVLEQGYWNFALRTVKLTEDTSITVEFGFTYAFQIPTDYVRLNMISSDERFLESLKRYEKEADHIHADVTPLYMRYVSDDTSFGGDLSRWPNTFTNWAGHYMAVQAAPKIKQFDDLDRLRRDEKALRTEARSVDASDEPPRHPQLSSWTLSRIGRLRHGDRGVRNRLTSR